MFSSTELSDALRAVTSSMQTPVIIVLLIFVALAVIMIGTLIAELFTERLRMKAKMPKLADDLRSREQPVEEVIRESGLLKRQRKALTELISHPDITPAMRESLAVRLLEEERAHYNVIVLITDLIARLGPMFGLLGTLIPLGPGIIALGRGDTYTLSTSLLTAFDTTAAGLLAAAAAFVTSAVRKRWYANYMSALEMAMECILEVTKEETEDAADRPDAGKEPETDGKNGTEAKKTPESKNNSNDRKKNTAEKKSGAAEKEREAAENKEES